MSKVKQWAWDEAEKAVDKIILQVKQNLITKETAISAMTKRSFSNKKIIKTLKFQFVPVETSIKKYCSWYKKDLS